MVRVIKVVIMAAVAVAVAVSFYGRRSEAQQTHVMTAAEHLEHIKMLSAGGDIHAGHALDEFARGVAQAAPNNPKLPADAEGVVARLASSPRKGEYVNIMVDGK